MSGQTSRRVAGEKNLRVSIYRIRRVLQRAAASVAPLWEQAGYSTPSHQAVDVLLNARFRRRLATVDCEARRIALRADAAVWPPRLLREVLVHELAHLAVHARHANQVRAHGPEWQALMDLAGLATSATMQGACGFDAATQRVEASALPQLSEYSAARIDPRTR